VEIGSYLHIYDFVICALLMHIIIYVTYKHYAVSSGIFYDNTISLIIYDNAISLKLPVLNIKADYLCDLNAEAQLSFDDIVVK
jgi:hypothetical protein